LIRPPWRKIFNMVFRLPKARETRRGEPITHPAYGVNAWPEPAASTGMKSGSWASAQIH
jgi:hypothetical protein